MLYSNGIYNAGLDNCGKTQILTIVDRDGECITHTKVTSFAEAWAIMTRLRGQWYPL